jgi:anaerobic selenocysteine-containing dehydrogenase
MGEAKSNWDVMRLLAAALGFDDSWLQQEADEVIAEVLCATARHNPALQGITLETLQADGAVALRLADDVPFAGAEFPTPSGRVELYSQTMAEMGLDPLPAWRGAGDDGNVNGDGRFRPEMSLELITAAGHYFVTSSFANQEGLLKREGAPAIEIHPLDAALRRIAHGEMVRVENGRGWCELRAVVTENVRPGVAAAPKGHWSKRQGGRNVNWTTSDELADMAGQSTFHSNRVWVSRV